MSIGLKLYLANAKRAGQHSLRLQKHATSTDDNDTRLARPAGQLLWLHAGTKCQFTAITELIRQLSGEHTQLSFLVTTPKNTSTDTRFQECCKQPCLQIIVPDDTPQQVDKFLNHWQPAMGIWLGPVLRPALVVGSRKKQIGLYMVNANSRASIETKPRYSKGITTDILRRFNHIHATNGTVSRDLVKQGARAGSVTVAGLLQEGVNTLYCDDRDRDEMAHLIAARPLWLAAEITQQEEDSVISAHRIASRLSHRLLLILVPDEPERGAEIARQLRQQGWIVAQRSLEQEPDEHVQVFIGDTDEEMGLWYRLAPVCFMGKSLDKTATGQSPLDAAALGCAILHGSNTERHKDSYHRLNTAGAARKVEDEQQLAVGVQELLAPDKAAAMAHAGWDVSTSGAQAADLAVELITTALDELDPA
ncbi:MAG TPA: 3-deoxy-D-manno-octulosonic acid transferase [Rhodobacteraceae bacterium]|nr:3-deoxy-D-manno-octulosonic acid transferase [Paracoccaceae bacterium]